jgi:hypothetical protein
MCQSSINCDLFILDVQTQNLSDEDMKQLIFKKRKKDGQLWSKISMYLSLPKSLSAHLDLLAEAVPQRSMMAVYKHVHRMYNTSKQQGRWSNYEDDILLQ